MLPRSLLLVLVLWVLPAHAQTLRYLGQQIVPYAHEHAGTTVGGLSGLDYDAASNRFVVISDDRSERQAARFYALQLDIDAFNTREEPGFGGVRLGPATTLRAAGGAAHAEGAVDPESIRFAGDGGYWWASEGNAKRGLAPSVEKIGVDGITLQRLEFPDHVLPADGKGVRDNLAFESLALLDGRLYAGTENALVQDGPKADLKQPSPVRILVFDAGSGKRLAEHVLEVNAVATPPPLPGMFRTNGLVELLGGQLRHGRG